MKTLTIIQGDQYAIPFPIKISGQLTTPDNVTGIRIKLDSTLKEYPGELSFDAQRVVWCYPVTETLTRSWNDGKMIPCQVGVKLGTDEFHYTQTFVVDVGKNIITEAWGE